jgi:hypothetical protein
MDQKPIIRSIVRKLKKKFKGKYEVIPESDKKHYTPFKLIKSKARKNEGTYNPDIIIKKRGKIRYLIEVETGDVRKSIPGAIILADYAIFRSNQENKKKDKPYLFFVKADTSALKMLRLRVKIANRHVKHIKPAKIGLKEDIIKRIT